MSFKGALNGVGYGMVGGIAGTVVFAKYNTMGTSDFAALGIVLIILGGAPTVGLVVGAIIL